MLPNYDYGIVTNRRWLWPVIDMAAVLLVTTMHAVTRHVTRDATRCDAAHCNHHYWKAGA